MSIVCALFVADSTNRSARCRPDIGKCRPRYRPDVGNYIGPISAHVGRYRADSMFARGLDVGQMSAISANMADLSRYAADVGQMSAISANMADLSRYAADVGLMSAISADMANQCRSSADVGPTCEAIWV